MTAGDGTVAFLARASREYADGMSVFTGFHWPVLAAEVARRLRPGGFMHYFEAGAGCDGPGRLVPTSTTDYAAYAEATCYAGTMADVLLGLARHFDRVVLDAANVDVLGRVNSTAVGTLSAPKVRLPGGGGAADVAHAARELVLLHGGADVSRIQRRVEHVTAAPGPSTRVRLVTRWGVVALGSHARLLERAEGGEHEDFVEHLRALGVDVCDPGELVRPDESELAAAQAVLVDAAARGYTVAHRRLDEQVWSR